MPKKSEATGATAVGLTGVVIDANQRLWELDPELDINGELIEGEHPDHAEPEVVEAPTSPDDAPRSIPDTEEPKEDDEEVIGQEGERADSSDANNAAPKSGSKSSTPVENAPDKEEDASTRASSARSKSPNAGKSNR